MQAFSNILTLTTDWHQLDYYLGMLTGRILSIAPSARLATISHQIPLHRLTQAAFVLRSSFAQFPLGTAHLCMVNSDNEGQQILVFQHDGHYFIAPDNGIISLIANQLHGPVYGFKYEQAGGFASLNAIGQAFRAISQGLLGQSAVTTTYETRPQTFAIAQASYIEGYVIYIDSYGNAITNIERTAFERIGRGRSCRIRIRELNDEVELVTSFSQAGNGDLIALFNSLGLLELALYNDQIALRYNLELDTEIIVDFLDNTLTLS